MAILKTSSFSNVRADAVARAILEREFNYKLDRFTASKDNKSSPAFIQKDSSGDVNLVVELRGWAQQKESQFEEITKVLMMNIKEFTPDVLIFMVFHFLEGDLKSKLINIIDEFTKDIGKELDFRVLDVYWIAKKLYTFPDIENKYFKNEKLTRTLNIDNIKEDNEDGEGTTINNGTENEIDINKIKDTMYASPDKKYYLASRPKKSVKENEVVGTVGKFGYEKSLVTNHEFELNGFVLEYNTEENKISNLYEVVLKKGLNRKPYQLKKLYEFKGETNWNKLENDTMIQSLINSMTSSTEEIVISITINVFKTILENIEITPTDSDPMHIENELVNAGFFNDSAYTGNDLLDFENDVRAFAAIMAHKDTKPPLAVALFGNWGTGKSFFMQHLQDRIERLSKYQSFTKSEPEQVKEIDKKDQVYCKGIVQICFNAWSYLDANLWAGLVSSIFDRLDEYITKSSKAKNKEQEVQSVISEKLMIASQQRIMLQEQKSLFTNKKEKLEKDLNDLRNKEGKIYKQVVDKSREDLLNEAINKTGELTDNIKTELENYGITREIINSLNPDALYNEAVSWITFIKNFWKFKRRQSALLIGILLVALYIVIDPYGYLENLLDQSFKNIATILGFAGPFIYKFISQYSEVKRFISPLRMFKDDFNKNVLEVETEYQNSVLSYENQLSQKQNEISETEKNLNEVNTRIENYRFELKHTITKRALFSFIQEKANAGYEDYLGIVSIIRRDFEVLSELFQELAIPEDITASEKEEWEKRLQENENFRSYFDVPLERIILYIDDLDRCSDEKVLEVLQAVHLLMAYPLFTVVVGVDKRCVNNALRFKNLVQYSKYTESKDPKELKNFGIEVIEPREYLEKIFQIPFHLKTPSDTGIQKLINDLLKDHIERSDENTVGATEVNPSDQTTIPDKNQNDVIKPDKNDSGNNANPNEGSGGGKEPVNEAIIDIRPENLKISKKEFEYIKEISWIIGSSPRTAKRFINIYRVIRAHKQLVYKEDDKENLFLVIMFILGVCIGESSELGKILLNGLKPGSTITISSILIKNPNLKEIKEKIEKNETLKPILKYTGKQLKEYTPLIERFSFIGSV